MLTLAIIKPDAVAAGNIGKIIAHLEKEGFKVREAQLLYERLQIPTVDVTECSIEEIASRILDRLGLERRVRP